jgi:hypothetical protein
VRVDGFGVKVLGIRIACIVFEGAMGDDWNLVLLSYLYRNVCLML